MVKRGNAMKKIIALILLSVMVFGCIETAEAKQESKSNWQIVKELCRKEGYSNILYIDGNKTTDRDFWQIVDHRRGRPYIVVEKVVSKSDGTGYGWYSTKTKNTNYVIGYNKKIPKGRTVTSYVIWNPKTNYCDDVIYVVDNRTYR